MNCFSRITVLLLITLFAGCAALVEEDVVIVEPIIEEPIYEAPVEKAPSDEACSSGDGIGGTGCPAID